MSQQPISDEAALRVGLAARELPDGLDNRHLLELLIGVVGGSLTLRRLSRIRYGRFRSALLASGFLVGEAQCRTALAYLHGRRVRLPADPPPPLDRYRQGDMPNSIRIACSSNGGDKINAPFANCRRFLIYQVSELESRLVEIRVPKESTGGVHRHDAIAQLIEDCHVLYTTSIGGRAAAKVVNSAIHPIQVQFRTSAKQAINELQRVLRDRSRPPWLTKLVGGDEEERQLRECES